ncbi:hypothetical protein [Pseudotabrizicola sp. 4114]|uniref:hypothetical protein n=1 Tax=Pseudotabrizicola sp. 4114 TaxID=2817731 RepID=UPI002854B8C8|nr:type IV secretory pathway VirB10-like protein [Pseudorhodobacter sp. 4114]
MADPHIPPKNPTYTTTTPPNVPPHSSNTSTTHIHETRSTNWFVYLLGGAVIAVGIVAWLMSGDDTQPTTGNNVTIESPATAPEGGPVSPVPDGTAPSDPIAPAPADPVAPAPADPVAPAPADPAPADPVAPAPADPAAPAPAN